MKKIYLITAIISLLATLYLGYTCIEYASEPNVWKLKVLMICFFTLMCANLCMYKIDKI